MACFAPVRLSNEVRINNLPDLVPILERHLQTRDTQDWLERMEAAGLPAGPVMNVCEMHADPQAVARDMIVTTDHPVAGATNAIGCPIKFSETPAEVNRPAPTLGQHGPEVLAEAGYGEADIKGLLDKGALVMSGTSG